MPTRSKTTEDIIKHILLVYIPHSEVTITSWLTMIVSIPANNLTFCQKKQGFTKICTSPYIPTGNSIIEHTQSFLKASIRKCICNHQVDWDETVHIATMAYNVFPHSSSGESPFYLMFGCDPFMPTLFKLLLSKLWYRGDKKCKIHLCEKFTWWHFWI